MGRKKRSLPNAKLTQSFDGLANKFDENIYGTSKGQLRHQLLLNHLSSFLDRPELSVLDAGGGTGIMSLEFAQAGHNITLADVSKDVLAVGKERLKDFTNACVVVSQIVDIKQSYDLIICHAVLEWLTEPKRSIEHLLSLLPIGGVLSLSFFNHDAKIFNNLLYGNFDYVALGLPAKNTVRLNPHNAQKPAEIVDFIEQKEDFSITKMAGIRCIHDYMIDKDKIANNYDALFEMERIYGSQEPYMWLGKYFYLQVRRDS